MKEIIITSSVLIVCIMLIRIIFKGKISSRLQYALWLLVALRLIIPVSAQIYMAIGSVDEFRIMDLTRRLEARVGDVAEQLEQPVTFATSVNSVAGQLAAKYILAKEMDLPEPDGPTSVFLAGKTGFTWLDVLRGIWLGGMVIVALWMIITNIVFARRLHKGRKEFVLPEPDESDLPQGKALLGVGIDKWNKLIHSTKIYTVEGLASPCLHGIPFREAVYLTPDAAEDAERLRHVLTHEMCHKKHCDSLWSILRSILLVIYWVNPFVWTAAVLSKRDCELACDEEALLILGEKERISYGETLLSIITRKGKLSDIACTATTMTGSGKSIKERIRFIAEKPHVLRVAVAAVLALVVLISVLVFTKNPLFHGKPLEEETVLTTGDMQIVLPETIAGISGYETDEDDGIVIYQLSSGEEVGRFCEMSYGEAVLLVEQGREVVPLGDYGYNVHLEEFMRSFYFPTEETIHYYTPYDSTMHNYNAPEDSMEDDSPFFFEGDIVPGDSYNDGRYYIPSPQNSDWKVIPLSEEESKRMEEELRSKAYGGNVLHEDIYNLEGAVGEGVRGTDSNSDDTTYLLEDENIAASESMSEEVYYPTEEIEGGESVDYLPNEEITVTARPTGTSTKCYVYVKADYVNVENQYLSELDYINSELMAATSQVIVTE